MDINSIKQVQARIKEIKQRVQSIQNTYGKNTVSDSNIKTNVAEANTSTDSVKSNAATQESNSVDTKISDDILKTMLFKKNKSKETIDVNEIQALLQKAITQYTSNGKLFNIEE